MCCDPQGVAHVMIQSFQLSSCTLCNAPIQNVSETPRVFYKLFPFLFSAAPCIILTTSMSGPSVLAETSRPRK